MAGQLLVPTQAGLLEVSPATGAPGTTIPVDRGTTSIGPIGLAVAGNVLLEQRGATVTALK